MELTRGDPRARQAVQAAAGPLAAWLCEVVPGLGWEPAADPVEAWERGGAAERIDALRRLRATDPAAARALLAAGLGGERAEMRAACYGALAVGLGPDDEAVLERALDDRVASVRGGGGGPPRRAPRLGLVGPHGSAGRADGARGRTAGT